MVPLYLQHKCAWLNALSQIIQERFEQIRDITQGLSVYDIDTVNENFLDFLAWQINTPWFESSTIPEKRRLLKSALLRKRFNGTEYAIHKALTDAGFYNIAIAQLPYNQDLGTIPFSFSVSAMHNSLSVKDAHLQLSKIVEAHKNVRSRLVGNRIMILFPTMTINSKPFVWVRHKISL